MKEQNDTKFHAQKKDIEKLLAEGHVIQIHPVGSSMYPLFVSDRDEAVIAPVGGRKLRRGDVVLYRRDGGILVLHRICRITAQGLYLVGDHQTQEEGPLRPDQIKGILVAFIRRGKHIQTTQPFYRLLSRLWLWLRPVRHRICLANGGSP
jgi:hypothetical protein